LPAVVGAATSAPPVATNSVNGADSSEVRESPAQAADSEQQFALPRGLTKESFGGQPMDVSVKTADKTSTGRRTNGKSAQGDDSGRRTTDGNDSRSAQRSDSTVATNQLVGAQVLNAATSDAQAGQASNTGDESKAAVTKSAGTKSDLITNTLVRPQRGHVGAGRAVLADGTPALPHVDASRFVGRVAKAIRTASERGGALHLRLSPPELGSLRLQLTVENGVMSATLEADSSATRQVLLDHLPALRERLAEQNIRIERFDVDVRQEGSGGQADARASQQEQRGQQPHETNHRRRLQRSPNGEEPPRVTDTPLPRLTSSGINVLA
jgi:flagellar hook-length control protein FliK